MKIKLASINLEVADPQRSKRFYIDVLGMTENLQRSHAPAFVFLESEGANVTLAAPQSETSAQPSGTMELGFEVDDFERVQAHFARLGVQGFTSQNMGWGDVIEGHDSDGHRISIYRLASG